MRCNSNHQKTFSLVLLGTMRRDHLPDHLPTGMLEPLVGARRSLTLLLRWGAKVASHTQQSAHDEMTTRISRLLNLRMLDKTKGRNLGS